MSLIKTSFALGTLCAASPILAKNISCDASLTPIVAQEKPQLLSQAFKFLEGPTWSETQQAFYFSEMDFSGPQTFGPKANIYQLQLPNEISLIFENSGSNGLIATGDQLIAMTHDNRAISTFNLRTKQRTTLATHFNKVPFNSPNDVALDSNNTLYFTDPTWQLGARKQQSPYTGLYRYNNQDKVTLLDASLDNPNGVIFSNDYKTLFVGDYSNRVFSYQVSKEGKLSNKRVFANINVPDGMAIDCADNLYVASHGDGKVLIFNQQGKKLSSIDVAPKVTNIAFGGEQLTTLLITTANGLYRLTTQLPGKAY
ncbi:SMP-30/gluconolactonase/LRE family protein [Thalassotalea sp. PLHSN55]|uniref:SMP-30/gluconolactonase/LRE family protein n=1 Tax=Thalassotalea sp. PLHSN55 TaxID=3435888 RepID=UPI003F833BE3